MKAMVATALRQIRASLQNPAITQEGMAHLSGVTLMTYRRAEGGKNTTYTTARAILNTINTELQKRGMSPVELDDLGLNIV